MLQILFILGQNCDAILQILFILSQICNAVLQILFILSQVGNLLVQSSNLIRQVLHILYDYSNLVVLLYFMGCLSLTSLFSIACDLLVAQNKISGSLIACHFDCADLV